MTHSQTLARFISETKYENIPDEVIEFTKLCILDWLGTALAGKDKAPIQMINQFVEETGGNPQSTTITGIKTSAVNAALLNGAASHIVELDDVHKGSILHAGTVVIPAALSIAEAKNCSGKELIEAVVVGYEICFRIGEAVSPSHYYYWHNTATCGTFGAAAAAAKLLGLNEAQIASALGSAGTQAAGLWEFIEDGAMSKQLHPAKAASNGLISALLAEKGFTSASKILEGKRGFFKAMSDEYDESKITQWLGKSYKIIENSFKIHASCRHTHPAIDMIIALVKENPIQLSQVSKINVKTYQVALDITDNSDPQSVYAAKFSLQFCVALGLINESASLYDYNEDTLWDETIRKTMSLIAVSVDPEVNRAYPEKWGAVVEIELTNGKILSKQTNYPKGDPENAVTSQDLIAKFEQLTSEYDVNETKMYIERIMNLETFQVVSDFFEKKMGDEPWGQEKLHQH
ncbi:MmgE/PrpD family protein [Peribacillus sp. TH14]|uniref:MmgE/PrpD family protein n=1 Tax=Peribacillus sp. TH14 TaxID=2798481 RepID=UPI001913B220|nr:MmgE/PrpD family protein [Peribacillus sp. TH14]MBK5502676.1 MmgE/PrpD family protein [Peribacillus sp. TH14]